MHPPDGDFRGRTQVDPRVGGDEVEAARREAEGLAVVARETLALDDGIESGPGLAPLSKRPYSMAVDALLAGEDAGLEGIEGIHSPKHSRKAAGPQA
ncbi:MAG: hypothetical protein J0L75_00450 [Spirochaetes bacterium]|nr:hypothetical protein [Spirochaetota bacterium]